MQSSFKVGDIMNLKIPKLNKNHNTTFEFLHRPIQPWLRKYQD